MNKLFLVTGAGGHLGNVIVQQLIGKGEKVRALVFHRSKSIPEEADIFIGNIVDKESLRACFENTNDSELVVIHCAGIVSIASKIDNNLFDTNVNGTKNMVELSIEYNASKFIYVSSVHAIEEKHKGEIIKETKIFSSNLVVGAYAKTKAEATAYVLKSVQNGLNAIVVHPSGIIGPYDYGKGHLTTLVIDYCKGMLKFGIKGGYDFVDVRDVANGIIVACEKGRIGECYILSNKFFEVWEVLQILHEITGRKEIKTYLPYWFVRLTAGLSELYYKFLKQTPLYTAYSIYTLNSNALFSHEKADIELGYTTRNFKATLKDTVNWLKKQGKI